MRRLYIGQARTSTETSETRDQRLSVPTARGPRIPDAQSGGLVLGLWLSLKIVCVIPEQQREWKSEFGCHFQGPEGQSTGVPGRLVYEGWHHVVNPPFLSYRQHHHGASSGVG